MLIRRAWWAGRLVLAFALLAVRPVADAQAARAIQAESAQPTAAAEVASPTPQAQTEAPITISVAEEPSAAEKPSPRSYTIRKGDSLSRIAKRFGVTTRELAKANGLKSPNHLRVGVKLRIPGAARKQAATQDTSVYSTWGLGGSALLYRGVPYRYAGMSSRGMDCSGLVARVLQLHGIRAPHNSRELYKIGNPVARKDLQPDDLVFFSTRGKGISHVGIYLGGGEFVHASSAGRQVRTDSLAEGYYAKRYVGARRIP
jgi:cell wall-associated NlpC family hydrolase